MQPQVDALDPTTSLLRLQLLALVRSSSVCERKKERVRERKRERERKKGDGGREGEREREREREG